MSRALLLDTHALVWVLTAPERLCPDARADLADPGTVVHVSAASTWELAIKAALGKLPPPPPDLVLVLDRLGFVRLPVSVEDSLDVQSLPLHHRDPSTGCSWRRPAGTDSCFSPTTPRSRPTTSRRVPPEQALERVGGEHVHTLTARRTAGDAGEGARRMKPGCSARGGHMDTDGVGCRVFTRPSARRVPRRASTDPYTMIRLRHLALSALLLPGVAAAQKPQPVSPLERGADPVFELAADGMTYARTGRSAMLVAMNATVAPGSDEAMARAALAQYHGALGLRTASASDLEFVESVQSPAGTVVRFRQTVDGVPVWGPMTVVGLDNERRAQSVANGYRADVALASTAPGIEASAARAAVLAHLGMSELNHEETRLMVWPAVDGARLAWVMELQGADPRGFWEGVVDAHTGEILRVADRNVYHSSHGEDDRRTALPTVESHPLYAVADGTAMIFDPDPLTRAGATYGQPGYVDGNDANTPQLAAARTAVTLRDLRFDGTNYHLDGPWAQYVDWDSPAKGTFSQASPDWNHTRDADAFEASNVYWHIDNYMRYLNNEIGVAVRPTAYATGVRYDAHGWGGADNSSYSGGSAQRLSFGEGGVDDAEDADVILHELGHGLHHWLAGGISNGDGLSEGFGDYVAVSYTRSLGLLSPSTASYNWVFKWDGHNPFWPGRVTNFASTYPTGSAPHARGQHWGTSNMRIWNAIGRERADKAVFEGLRLTNSSTTQPQAANAVMQAAANMGYTLAEVQAMFSSYQTQGYPGLVMPNIVSNEEGAGRTQALLTAATPNPFNGLTAFELMVERDQHVSIEVFDALGRLVATLFEGTARAGMRYPFALEAAGLQPGVYVYRATGETFSLAQRATLVR